MIYIIVPVYNRVELTKKFYKSLLNQNLDFTLILIDDGSQDETNQWFSGAGFTVMFTICPVCNPIPDNENGALRVFCLSLIYFSYFLG